MNFAVLLGVKIIQFAREFEMILNITLKITKYHRPPSPMKILATPLASGGRDTFRRKETEGNNFENKFEWKF